MKKLKCTVTELWAVPEGGGGASACRIAGNGKRPFYPSIDFLAVSFAFRD